MHQKKIRNEQPGVSDPESILKLLPLLETPDLSLVDSISDIIHENLCCTKDSRLLNGIIDYYVATESQRSIDILLRLKEPHDKHMFDKLSELMRNENYRYKSLQLFMNLVHRQPSWLHKIAHHRIMHTLLNLLKTDQCAPNLLSGLIILVCLLPMIPSQFGQFLSDTFEIFSKLAAWGVKKPSSMIEVYMVHLHIGIYSLFHRLYGLFPCNFLAYLRSYYGGREFNEDNYKVFSIVIKPMLERVRLHPLLVTASKETELSTTRWKKMAYHDIIVECASISLDFVEGSEESIRNKALTSSVEQNFNSLESANMVNCSSQSSCSMTNEPDSIVSESSIGSEQMWSPNNASVLPSTSTAGGATSPALLGQSKQDLKNYFRQISSEDVPLDIAIEAKPENLKREISVSNSSSYSKDSNLQTSNPNAVEMNSVSKTPSLDKNIIPAVEAKEDDIDREVSDLTSQQGTSQISATDIRHDTPFCSTTLNLTEEHGEIPVTMSNSEKSDSFIKSTEDETEEMYSSIPESEAEAFVQSFTRYRYLSHHGPPPDIPLFPCAQKPKVARSASCPENIYPSTKAGTTTENQSESTHSSTHVTAACNNVCIAATTSAFVPVTNSNGTASSNRLLSYDKLLPGVLNPLTQLEQVESGEPSSLTSHKQSFSTLSPPELLDRYIQLGNITYLNNLSAIPITSTQNTDWTHFGGRAPADEVTILRNQILLLHNLLLFERHRKDVHSERNRRILGRAKRFKMQEEHIGALKDQISLLEQDNRDLSHQVDKKTKAYQQLLTERQHLETNLRNEISRTEAENSTLLYSNKEIKGLLVAQRKENDEIREIYKKTQSEITLLRHQLDRANKKVLLGLKIEKDSVFLSKQVVLLQELISHYKERMELLKDNNQPDLGESIMNNAAMIEIEALKQKIDEKHFQLHSTKTSISHLEQSQADLRAKLKESKEAFERMKALHKDEVVIRDERIQSLKNISAQKDSHILNLFERVESAEKRLLEQQLTLNALESTQQPTSSNPSSSGAQDETESRDTFKD